MKSFTTLVVTLLAALTYVAAHGFVSQVKIDGKSYKGNVPSDPKIDSPIRMIKQQDPVKGATNPAVNCGPDATKAALVASANPGSNLEFYWNAADLSHWPHNVGPIMTYMAECTGATCDKFDSTNAKWFKINELGKKGSSSTWYQQDLFDGKSVSVSLPDDLKAGNYLIRNEIIALHLADSKGGAEFYPSCTQLRVGGSGNALPSADELVSLPGAYSDNDAGIFDKTTVYNNAKYPFPGPAVAKLVAVDSSNNTNNPLPPPSTPTASPSASHTPSPTGKFRPVPIATGEPAKSCKKTKGKRSSSLVAEAELVAEDKHGKVIAPVVGKRHFSRVMARIAPHAASI
ncbi:hypothetical protein EUX98_g9423 [Antrodiella citrinella]|uniref:lytic cellulose monooxygenase (C4-dehydrogenating) n=1 Tax=Antrodiella citrinella TaxID=2447956 RepID=A0A4S4LTE4_9APHY|nr:hypothetical protein EUX98_g9423 [Antrodiella citrinella]